MAYANIFMERSWSSIEDPLRFFENLLFFTGFSVYNGSQPEKSVILLKSKLIKFAGAVLV